MASHLYANLAPMGWVEVDPDSVVSRAFSDPVTWIKEGGQLDSVSSTGFPNNLDHYPFVNISYQGRDYRVSPFHLQVVTD